MFSVMVMTYWLGDFPPFSYFNACNRSVTIHRMIQFGFFIILFCFVFCMPKTKVHEDDYTGQRNLRQGCQFEGICNSSDSR